MGLFSFLLEFFRQPRRTGGIAPSSKVLAQGIKRAAERFAQPGARIVEIGAGNGAITQYLLELDRELVVVESNQRLGMQLSRKFPEVRVISSAFQKIPSDILDQFRTGPLILVSSLPFASLPRQEKDEIKAVFYSLLKTAQPGVLIQYTYKLGDPLRFEKGEIQAAKDSLVFRNLPPASIWTYRLKELS